MRKYLVGVAAAAAGVALAMPATAQDATEEIVVVEAMADEMAPEMMDEMAPAMTGLSMSGSMKQDIGFGSYVGGAASNDDTHFKIGATITFKATGTTDGGLAVAATVSLAGKGGGDITASHLDIAGGFGSINLGQNGHASNMHGNKGVGGGYGGGGYYDCGETWTPGSCGGPPGNDKGVGIRYSTPAIAGFQAGVSFQPEAGATTATTVANDKNILAVGANFTGDFAGTSVTIGGGWVSARTGVSEYTDPTSEMVVAAETNASFTKTSHGIGATVGIGGTELHARYDRAGDSHMNATEIHAAGAVYAAAKKAAADKHPNMNAAMYADSSSYGIGIDHTIGALKFGIGYGVKRSDNASKTGSIETEWARLLDSSNHPITTPAASRAARCSNDVDFTPIDRTDADGDEVTGPDNLLRCRSR